MAKNLCFAGERALFREPVQRLPQKQGCPFAVINFLFLPFSCPRNLCLRFCGSLIVQVCQDHTAATFQSPSTIAHIGHRYGLPREEAYALASVGVDLRIHEVVDAPNWVVGAFLPESIFDERRRS